MDSAQLSATDARTKARIAGALWLGVIVLGVAAMPAAQMYVSDPDITAARILAAPGLYRAGVVGTFVSGLLYVALVGLLYEILRPVSKTLSLMQLLFAMTGCAAGAVVTMIQLMPLVILTGRAAAAFTPEQAHGLAHTWFQASRQGFYVGMICFGIHILLTGTLIARSRFLPRWIGQMLMVGGSCYALGSTTILLRPASAAVLFPVVVLAAFIGEGTLALWLTTRGLDSSRWAAVQSGVAG